MSASVTGIEFPPAFPAELRDHRFRGVNPVYRDALLDERWCDAPCPNREFGRGSGAGIAQRGRSVPFPRVDPWAAKPVAKPFSAEEA